MRGKRKIAIVLLLSAVTFLYAQTRDSDRLGMALDYYSSGKYHEALLIFEQLDRHYELNPRFHAYMGICYYHEWEYDKACQYLDQAIPKLGAFAPVERFVYYYINGECHFLQKEYETALPYYEQALTVCPNHKRVELLSHLERCRALIKSVALHPDTIHSDVPHDIRLDSLYQRSIETDVSH